MKKLDKLVIKDFIPPYIMAFFVAEFVLLMIFLWKYIDDIAGKGISLPIILELLFYFGVSIIPKAVPVTILIASVMVFGNLAERYELSSMKSAGISLTRIFLGGILFAIFTSIFSLFASNYLKPRAYFNFLERLNSVKSQKLGLSFEEDVFSKDFRNYVIRFGDIDPNGSDIGDVLIYDHSANDKSKLSLLTAESGSMYTEEENNLFVMELDKGEQYREMVEKTPDKSKHTYPLLRTKFESWTKVFDMSDFDMEAQNFSITRREHDLLNAKQLLVTIDSFDNQILTNSGKMVTNFQNLLEVKDYSDTKVKEEASPLPEKVKAAITKKDEQVKTRNRNVIKSITNPATQYINKDLSQYTSLIETFDTLSAKSIIKASKYLSNKRNDLIRQNEARNKSIQSQMNRCILRYHQIYAWALICIIFLFIGAPLGSIVRKGGYGYPLLIAIIFFMLFIVIDMMGDKLTTSNAMNPIMAGWLSNIILGPVALIITIMALRDSNFSFVKDKFIELRIKVFGR